MNSQDEMKEALQFARMIGEKTADGKLDWRINTLARGTEDQAMFSAYWDGKYMAQLKKDKNTFHWFVQELNGPVLISQDVSASNEFGYDSPEEKDFSTTIFRLYDLVRRRVFDIDRKLKDAQNSLGKL